MKVFSGTCSNFIALVFLLAHMPVFSGGGLFLQEKKDLAFMQCLRINYLQLGYDIYKHDVSMFYGRYAKFSNGKSVEYDLALVEFLEKHVSNFHEQQVSIKNEIGDPPPFTPVFAKCMDFYKSKELDAFVRKH